VGFGNLNLKAEKADHNGLGVVFGPSFAPGFTARLDYWQMT